jgi:hypothetical protein
MHDQPANNTMTQDHEAQLTSTVMMIRPAGFESNPLTAASNRFQGKSASSPAEQQVMALREFDELVAALRAADIDVIVIDDTTEPHTPDAIFPNNWISTHADGRVVLYPMEAENRRTERREDIVERLDAGRLISEVIDLSEHEADGHYLEGTGSMVLDRAHHVAYACVSTRTHLDPLGDFAQRLGYDVVAFDAVDSGGVDQREAVLARLRETGHDIMHLSYAQLDAFAGNMLELRNRSGEKVVALSQQAWDSLDAEQRATLSANGRIVCTPIDNIEASAGGSVRCMLAEIHLPVEGASRL